MGEKEPLNVGRYYSYLNDRISVYKKWKYTTEAMEYFQDILQKAQEAGVPLVFCFAPSSVDFYAIIHQLSYASEIQRIKRIVSQEVPVYIKMMPDYDYVVLLQVTSPFWAVEDIDGASSFCLDNGCESCVSVTEAEHSPYWMYRMDERNRLQPLLKVSKEESYQRQKLLKVYQLNGAVYVADVDFVERRWEFIGGKHLAIRCRRSDLVTLVQ